MKAVREASINYEVDVTLEQFTNLESHDYLDSVLPPMEKAGAWSVEYNGHFGLKVKFTCKRKDKVAVLDVLRVFITKGIES